MPKKLYRGKWAGLSAKTIGNLMGCSHTKARRILEALEDKIGKVSLDDIGYLITKYRIDKEEVTIDRLLGRWKLYV